MNGDGIGWETVTCHKLTLLNFPLHISNLKSGIGIIKDDTLSIFTDVGNPSYEMWDILWENQYEENVLGKANYLDLSFYKH